MEPLKYLMFSTFCAGVLSCSLNGQELPRIKVSDNHRYIVLEDGRPFYWAGDTGWGLFRDLSFNRKVPGTTQNEMDWYLQTRKEQGFNVIHTFLTVQSSRDQHGNPPFDAPLNSPAAVQLNDAYFANVNTVITEAGNRGLYICTELGSVLRVDQKPEDSICLGWGTHAERLQKSYEYGWRVADKIKNHTNLIWGLGLDIVPTRRNRIGEENAANNAVKYVELVRAMAEGVADAVNGLPFTRDHFDGKADYTTTLMTFHVGATGDDGKPTGYSSAEWFHQEEWLDFNCHQGGRYQRYNPKWRTLMEEDYLLQPVKPCYEGESAYERNFIHVSNRTATFQPYDVRVAGYWSVFAGGFGLVYGHNGVNQFIDLARKKPRTSPGGDYVDWWLAVKDPGAVQVIFLKNLMLSRPYLNRIPDQKIVATDTGEGHERLQATRDSEGRFAFVYTTNGRDFRVDTAPLSGATINAWWFNPRDGETYTGDGIRTDRPFNVFPKTSVPRAFDPPGEPNDSAGLTGNDWVLVLDDAAQGFGVPGHSR